MPGNNSQVYELWMTIEDIIGRANLWPYLIRRYFDPTFKILAKDSSSSVHVFKWIESTNFHGMG